MGIVSFTVDKPAQIGSNIGGVVPRRPALTTTDNLSTVIAAGYLNPVLKIEAQNLLPTDVVDVIYSYNAQTNTGTYGVFTVGISNGIVTLTQWGGNSNAMLLNVANQLTSTGSIIANKVNGTEAANALTANGMAGLITTSSLTTAGGANYAIAWTNSFITSTSVVLLTIAGGTNTTENITLKCVPGNTTSTLTIYNNTAATALNGTIFISYLVM